MERGYQHGYSATTPEMFSHSGRQMKAMTMVSVLSERIEKDIASLCVLNVGGSAGVIDEYLARYFGRVVGIDIDEKAIAYANNNFNRDNLIYETGDAMNLAYEPESFDVVICSQVYEHVMDANVMMAEIFRVIKPGGVVYFAAGNRLMLNEPHYNLPLLSVLPRPLSHPYLKICGKGSYYYEKHLTYWGLKKLVNRFEITDYTKFILHDPEKYSAAYMIKPGSTKQKIACFLSKYAYWLVPGYIWILRKP
jgi:2-polyprenyl-3-methyl-5-hydroxy-6-metoxy-1,4-benzoquinol methylase